MKDELLRLWKEYKTITRLKNGMYVTPSFEGFMEWLDDHNTLREG